ncbi:hypothetical protein CPB84DRAFT_1936834, partial [Gymnopilus junonius]
MFYTYTGRDLLATGCDSTFPDVTGCLNGFLATQYIKVVGGMVTSIGVIFIPFFLMKRDTGEKIRVILHVIVLLDLFMTMFIGILGGQIIRTTAWDCNRPVFGFSFGQEDDGLTSAWSILEWGQEVDSTGISGIAR